MATRAEPAAEVGPVGAGDTALVVRAGDGRVLEPGVAEPIARLALVAGMGIAGARAVERTSRLVESGMAIGSGLELDTVLRRLLESARRVVGARYAALGVLSPTCSATRTPVTPACWCASSRGASG